jgi:hypothetical protein
MSIFYAYLGIGPKISFCSRVSGARLCGQTASRMFLPSRFIRRVLGWRLPAQNLQVGHSSPTKVQQLCNILRTLWCGLGYVKFCEVLGTPTMNYGVSR